jgi:tetraacyldisaccharide-1-P 4'-kinase
MRDEAHARHAPSSGHIIVDPDRNPGARFLNDCRLIFFSGHGFQHLDTARDLDLELLDKEDVA